MHFGLTDLRLFRHVAEAGSITAGAARAGLALASASARIRAMEAQAGLPLLERGRRGITPTPAGQTLLHHARLVTAQIDRMRGELGAYASGLHAQIRLLANTAAATEYLPEPLAAFLAANPNIDLDLEERPSPEIARAIAESHADLGIAAAHADLSGLEAHSFRTDRLVLVAPNAHPLATSPPIPFAEALNHDIVALSTDTALGEHLARHAARTPTRRRTRIRVPTLEAACHLVAQGAGLAVVPHPTATRWHQAGRLACIPLTDPWAERLLLLLTRGLHTLPPHTRNLADHLLASKGLDS